MFSKVNSFGIRGVEGFPVTVEADISDGLPSFIMVGYLSSAVREAQERVRTALKHAGYRLPPKRVTINLSPADVRKEGTAYDLAIAAAVLSSLDEWCEEARQAGGHCAFIGELGLDGKVKAVSGVLSRVYEASRRGIQIVFLPQENKKEGSAISNIKLIGVSTLSELTLYLKDWSKLASVRAEPVLLPQREEAWDLDYEELSGLPLVRRACEAAAAGKHNLLLIGPAGTGKTMAAKRIPTILPPMTLAERLEVSKIYSICGMLKQEDPLIWQRPFRSPHHNITAPALAGGGKIPRAGELSLASRGVLFLDELAEFPPCLLDLLRQPMEEECVTVSRMGGILTFPSSPLIVAAMNPCKCGFYPDLSRCRCTPSQIQRYLSRISGPFLDRMDLGVEVPRQDADALRNGKKGEGSAQMRARVKEARKRQEERFSQDPEDFPIWNSRMNRKQLQEYCRFSAAEETFFETVSQKKGFSLRAQDKIRRVARTLADLDGVTEIGREQLCEAIAFRSFEEKYWGRR